MSDHHLASKQAAAHAAAKIIRDDMLVGLGSGSTAEEFIRALAERCRDGLHIQAIAASKDSETLARKLAIPLLPPEAITHLDITVDGADEVDDAKQLIKGGGGALLREKVLATISQEMIVIVDPTKIVQKLGKFPLALEILPFCYQATLKRVSDLGLQNRLRQKENKIFVSDNGNYIADCDLPPLANNLPEIDLQLRQIPGVLETGLFLGIAGRIIIGHPDGTTTTIP